MKKWWKLGFCLIPIIGITSIPIVAMESNLSPTETYDVPADDAVFMDIDDLSIFVLPEKILETTRIETKKSIKRIFDKYRLLEWNDYYRKSNDIKTKDEILEPRLNDYSIENNQHNSSSDSSVDTIDDLVKTTELYENQDDQFKYFNDFLNFYNWDDTKDTLKPYKDDWLYLRWKYCASFVSKRANKMITVSPGKTKPLREIDAVDWIEAFTLTLPEPAGLGDTTFIKNIVEGFNHYYGIRVDVSVTKREVDISDAMICVNDMLMRIMSKPRKELYTNSFWHKKLLRIQAINKITEEYYQLLVKSLEPPAGITMPPELEKPLNAFVEEIMKSVNEISQIKLNDYLYSGSE